jgi:hypothetical protein
MVAGIGRAPTFEQLHRAASGDVLVGHILGSWPRSSTALICSSLNFAILISGHVLNRELCCKRATGQHVTVLDMFLHATLLIALRPLARLRSEKTQTDRVHARDDFRAAFGDQNRR